MKIKVGIQATALLATLALVGCGGATPATTAAAAAASAPATEPNQNQACRVSFPIGAHDCKEGQKIIYLPNQWGNEQLPIIFAGFNCDLRYTVVSNNGGVVCIYKPMKSDPPAAPAAASQPSSP